jgi:hypothetical protein
MGKINKDLVHLQFQKLVFFYSHIFDLNNIDFTYLFIHFLKFSINKDIYLNHPDFNYR